MTTPFTTSFGLEAAAAAAIREMGHAMNPTVLDRTRGLFAGRHYTSLPEGARLVADVAYGEHARQTIDICALPGGRHPVALFIPGGGFTGGDKAGYAHIARCFARGGFVGVTMNYRLAPDFLFPSGAQDVAAVIDWLAANIEAHGGDPGRIFVVGQSAGAVHLASALFDATLQPKALTGVRAAALLSGLYDIRPDMEVPAINLYFGNDPALCRQRSSVHYAPRSALPVLMTIAEHEPPMFAVQGAALLDALGRRPGAPPQFAFLRGHNHFSPVLGMGAPGDELGAAILAEFRRFC